MRPLGGRVVFDADVSERKILIVPIHTIRHTPYNPAARTKEGSRSCRPGGGWNAWSGAGWPANVAGIAPRSGRADRLVRPVSEA